MPKISLCMIVKNEAACLERCLATIHPFVDEIIIVDTGSTDDTIKIAKKFTNKIFHFTWCDDFSAARNFSLQHSSSDWILFLDADEVLAPKDGQKIAQLIDNPNANAYFLDQKEYTNDSTLTGFHFNDGNKNFLGYVIVKQAIRLFRRLPEIHFSWRIHESVAPFLEKKGITPLFSGIQIQHYKQEKDFVAQQEKLQKYLALGEQQCRETPLHPKPWYEIGLIYYAQKRYRDAVVAFEKVLALHPSQTLQKYTTLKLGRTYSHLHRYHDAITCFQQYLQLISENGETNKIAAEQSDMSVEQSDMSVEQSDMSVEQSQAFVELGLVSIKLHTFPKAKDYFLNALNIVPANSLARHNLTLLHLQLGEKEQAYALLLESETKHPSPFTYNTLGVLAIQEIRENQHDPEKKQEQAVSYFKKGIALSPFSSHEITISLYKNLIDVLIQQNKREDAQQYLQQLKHFQ